MASFSFNNEGHDGDGEDSLPKEFQAAEALTISQVKLHLTFRGQQSEAAEDEIPLSDAFKKSRTYCERFAKFKNHQSVNCVLSILQQRADFLTKQEMAMVANLCPENVDEAKALIPSLDGKIDDDDLRQMLEDIQTTLKYQG